MADAGKYVLRDLFWDERVNDVTELVPKFKRHKQGDVLDLDEDEATRLVDAGSVEPEGEREAREFEVAEARFRAALANLPDEVRAKVLGDRSPDEVARELQDTETPVEELHVHHPEARGFINPGHPKYAAAAHGEGGLEEPGERQASTEELDATQAALDDGSGDQNSTVSSRRLQAKAAKRSSGGSDEPTDQPADVDKPQQ